MAVCIRYRKWHAISLLERFTSRVYLILCVYIFFEPLDHCMVSEVLSKLVISGAGIM